MTNVREPFLQRLRLLVHMTLFCVVGQLLWGVAWRVPPDAPFVLRTWPAGAAVYRHVVQANEPWIYLGTAPTPRLRTSDLPCNLKIELWGTLPRAVHVTAEDVATRSVNGIVIGEYPPDGPLVLTPRVAVLVPLLYAIRDWPFAWAAATGWVLFAAYALALHTRLRTAWRLRKRLETGQLANGVELGGYLLQREIARGGMGRVFLARRAYDPSGEVVALKVMFDDEGAAWSAWTQAMREADVCRRLAHPNIVPLLDWGEEAVFVYIVMEYVSGETLRERLQQGTLGASEAARIGLQVSEGLLCAHQAKVVHCDIKPANLMISAGGTLKILDFGIARAPHLPSIEASGPIAGTPAYVAPETIMRRADWRADYYSLGVLLFEGLAGHLPFQTASTRDTLQCHLTAVPPDLAELRPDLDGALCALVQRLLEKDPARRVGAMTEIRDAFSALVNPMTRDQ